MSTMRERFRTQVREDVKRVAVAQLAERGPAGLSLKAIAQELGVSGPALYRYFTGRDELLTELILDAYGDLAEAVGSSRTLGEFAGAYRSWAREHPHRYRLLFAEPTPGYDAHQPRLVAAARRLMDALVALLGESGDRALRVWWRVHGFVSLEIDGNFASMGVDPDALFSAEIREL